MEVEPITSPLIIGYYPFRGKAQMMRLVCEYLHCPYVDRFFDPDEWKEFKEKETEGWVIKDMPFLQHDDFVVTGDFAMLIYVMELCGRHDLCGKSMEDKAKLDFMKSQSLRDTMLGLLCSERVTTSQEEMEKRHQMAELYEKKICHLMEYH